MNQMLISDFPLAFSGRLAKEIGVKEAIVYEYIKTCLSQDNDDGWARITYDQMQERLMFMSKKSIERKIKTLVSRGYIYREIRGVTGVDRANWYALAK
ncbi:MULTISPECIES: hypothetical protein [Staphylococcus intermedius group]|uniref:hypothetical protein n=1 Tax=Staphylococcus intermedius group TaxID=2815305 RepID=UPI0012D2EEAD|nr:hypothetical protein [Staphylococcus delphini]MTV23744.1 hypothetical protein [Staphylococcus delphini]NCJ14465.1 hypothetical protein [Staphylococcus pseudintermedius]